MLPLQEERDRLDEIGGGLVDDLHDMEVLPDVFLGVDYPLADFYCQDEYVLFILIELPI